MQILYLYIAKHHIEKIIGGYCFSNQFDIQYDVDSKTLKINDKPNFIDGFYSENITNLTAIIGKNGSGKTTLLKLIEDIFINTLDTTRSDNILVYKDDSDEIQIFSKYNQVINESASFIFNPTDIQPFPQSFSWRDITHDTNLITISHKFDGIIESKYGGCYNLKTECLLSDDYVKFTNNQTYRQNDIISIHNSSEIERQVVFLLSDINQIDFFERIGLRRNISFKAYLPLTNYYNPEIFQVSQSDKFIKSSEGKEEATDEQIASDFNLLFRQIISYGNQIVKNDAQTTFFLRLQREMLINFLWNYVISLHNQLNYIGVPIKKILNVFLDKFREYPLYQLIDLRYIVIELRRVIPHTFEDIVSTFSNYILFEEMLKPCGDNIDTFSANNIRLEIDGNLLSILKQYKKTQCIVPFLIFNWEGISSGEKTRLSTFARFYSLLNVDEFYREKDLIILFDECNLYLHPEWERRFLKEFVEFIQLLFGIGNLQFNKKKSIQIILTTHSPIILSDIPSFSLLALGNNKNLSLTFAANIHSLFKNEFIFEGGLIGDFAKMKIEELLDFLHNPKLTFSFFEDDYLALINLVGDDLIKKRLLDLYKNKFGNTRNLKQARRIELLKELDELNKDLGNAKN